MQPSQLARHFPRVPQVPCHDRCRINGRSHASLDAKRPTGDMKTRARPAPTPWPGSAYQISRLHGSIELARCEPLQMRCTLKAEVTRATGRTNGTQPVRQALSTVSVRGWELLHLADRPVEDEPLTTRRHPLTPRNPWSEAASAAVLGKRLLARERVSGQAAQPLHAGTRALSLQRPRRLSQRPLRLGIRFAGRGCRPSRRWASASVAFRGLKNVCRGRRARPVQLRAAVRRKGNRWRRTLPAPGAKPLGRTPPSGYKRFTTPPDVQPEHVVTRWTASAYANEAQACEENDEKIPPWRKGKCFQARH